jgi:hypothetical protein
MYKLWLIDADGNIRNAGKISCPDVEFAEEEAYRRADFMSAVYDVDIINVLCEEISQVS